MASHNGWQSFKFAEIAENVTVRVDDPSKAGVDRYVGLEHLDPDSLAIARWGLPTDVEATKLRFWPGDIIFGRRRAYQRKVGVADFEGICSAHALVLRAKPDVALPEFLPFFMQSEAFFDRALAISVGSLSPTINWRTLRAEEFDLPPIHEQRKTAELLWASEMSCRRHFALVQRLQEAKMVLIDGALGTGEERSLGDLLEICQYGLSIAASDDGAVPILAMTNVTDGGVDLSNLKYVNLSASELTRYQLVERDVLFNRTNSVELVGRTGLYEGEGDVVFASYLIRLRPSADLLPEYLNLFLNSSLGKRRVRSRLSKGVSQANISGKSLKLTQIPVPSIEDQHDLVERANCLDDVIQKARTQLDRSRALARALLSREL